MPVDICIRVLRGDRVGGGVPGVRVVQDHSRSHGEDNRCGKYALAETHDSLTVVAIGVENVGPGSQSIPCLRTYSSPWI